MINSIQSLRAIAAIYVVLYHAAIKVKIENNFTHTGESGVDLFFIISGFVITYTVVNSANVNWKVFLVKRLVRVIPIYWFLTLFFSGLLLFIPHLFQTYEYSFLKLIKSLAFIPQREYPVVYTGWTLNYEMYFYALFAISLFLNGPKAPFWVGSILLSSVILGCLIAEPKSPLIELVTSPLLIEFMLGIALCYLFKAGVKFSRIQSSIFILAGIACFFLLENTTRLFCYGIPWFFIFIGIVFSSSSLIESRLLIFLGNASYSIYLIHVFTLPVLHFVAQYFAVETESNPTLYLILYSLLGVLSGVACFMLVERPLTNRFKSIISKRNKDNKASSVDAC